MTSTGVLAADCSLLTGATMGQRSLIGGARDHVVMPDILNLRTVRAVEIVPRQAKAEI